MSLESENRRILKAIGNGDWIILIGGHRVIVVAPQNSGIRQNTLASELGVLMNNLSIAQHQHGQAHTETMSSVAFTRNSSRNGGTIDCLQPNSLSADDRFQIRRELLKVTNKTVNFQ